MNSIRKWLAIWQISALLLTALLVTLLTYHLAWDGFNRIRDYSLEQIAWAVVRHQGDHPAVLAQPVEADRFLSQVWDRDGKLVFASFPDSVMPRQKPGLTTLLWQGEEWHVMVLEDRGAIVQVANSTASRTRMFNSLGPWLMLPFVLMIFVLGGLIVMAINRALQPLLLLRREISQRSSENLSELPKQGYPEELMPIVGALNELLTRLGSAFAAQQRFIADAAHELRTPLTAVRLHAQIALGETDRQVRDEALRQMLTGVERATRQVDQLLNLARFDPLFGATRQYLAVDLLELAKSVVIEHSVLADSNDVDLGLGPSMQVMTPGDPDALRAMLGNLVHNAIRYAGPGHRVDVCIGAENGQVFCTVIDDGPGIPEAARATVLSPFCRLAGAETPGTGLGLAIVQEVVFQHAGTLEMSDSPGGGLTVHVRLPRTDTPYTS
ncbi:ATP-binding protein [Azonexus sp.]|uniref:ATP-binding protein n=1 Tax=Azonexus sp. TaxID=1872668 RepID=UPI0027B90820|nr:ATP-binding protein [Azonexus sp.]